ncbi:MAG: hypothetical protein HN683_04675 [Gammaproteobacteria bacterium]|nr:hypothetical protein [Gammaproteobacteria bacterium]
MAYRDDIATLGADHHYPFEDDSLDEIGAVNGTDSGVLYTGTAIAEDASNCMTTNTQGSISVRGDRVTLATTANINNSAQTQKAVCGWFMFDSFRPPPIHIYGEGDTTTKWQFIAGFGNNLVFEVVEATNFPTGLQVYGPEMVPNRAYHLCGIFLGNSNGNEVKLFVDGVEMTNADPLDRQPDTASLDARGVAVFGDAGTASQGVGGGTVRMSGSDEGYYNHWATFDGASADLSDTEIRETLFEGGVLATETIAAGTESAMQTALELIDNGLKGNVPCAIRVANNTGDTDFELSAIAITFDPLSSIHVQYTGSATLNWRNDRNSNATIFSTTGGGTITVQNETQLDISGLQNPTEVRVYEAGTTTEVAGEENVTDGLFESFVYVDSVDIMIVSLTEDIIRLESVDTSVGVVLQVSQFFDRNYRNPA